MKKLNLVMIMALSIMLVIATAGISQAAVNGPCSNCHTMHNSQGGDPMTVNPVSATPNDFLTISSCLGCHGAGGLGVTAPGAPNVFGDPDAGPSTMTAGGTFLATKVDAAAGDYVKVHNVTDIPWTNVEGPFADADPPGATSGSLGEGIRAAGSTTPNFNCAGATGCHGDHSQAGSDAGIRGFHHGSTAYRYCELDDGTDILGEGSSDWEAGGADATNHNVYSADTTAGISAFCAECHGLFHGTANTGSSSPFQRHPTNNLLSDATGWDLGQVTVDYNNNPFSFALLTEADPTTAYTTTNARVACVSCHRAHGTPEADILRFDYSAQLAGSTVSTGCLGCHERQRL
jgi:predicted CXXCH cytochrome family protein